MKISLKFMPRRRDEPFAKRPEPPKAGCSVEIERYRVTARQYESEPVRYIVRNPAGLGGIDGRGLVAGCRDWELLCDSLGWYPAPARVEQERVKSLKYPEKPKAESAKQEPKPTPAPAPTKSELPAQGSLFGD